MQALQTISYKDRALQNIEVWVFANVNRPIKGFEHKRNPDGTLFTRRQQVSSTRLQVLAVAYYFIMRGKSQHEVMQILQVFC